MSQNKDQGAVEVVQAYIDAIKLTQPDRLKEIFHPQATMSRHRPDGFLISSDPGESISAYMKKLPPTSETNPDFHGEILSVDQLGDMAAARIAERNLEGKDFDTFFLLHKVEGRWLITSKATRGVPIAKGS